MMSVILKVLKAGFRSNIPRELTASHKNEVGKSGTFMVCRRPRIEVSFHSPCVNSHLPMQTQTGRKESRFRGGSWKRGNGLIYSIPYVFFLLSCRRILEVAAKTCRTR